MLINAFIPAAGFGERLRPFTADLAKPLFPILGKPIIEHVYERIALLGPSCIGINMHHRREMISEWAASIADPAIRLFPEDPILGTGGALKNAAQVLGKTDVLVHNADILTDIDLGQLIRAHQASGDIATLAVHNHEKFNTVWIDPSGALVRVGEDDPNPGTGLCKIAYTGIAVYAPVFFALLPEGHSSVVHAWHAAVAGGRRIGTVNVSGSLWNDIGTIEAYAGAIREALNLAGEQVFVHPSVDCSSIDAEGFAVIEKGCVAEGRAVIRNSILLPGARIPSGALVEDQIVGKAGTSPLSFPAGPRPDSPLAQEHFKGEDFRSLLIGAGGSDRRYYRLSAGDYSCVLMECSAGDEDFARHLDYTRFFRRHSFPVAELLGVDPERGHALFEDLGDTSLYSWLRCGKDPGRVERMYESVLDLLAILHTELTEHIAECPGLSLRAFDHAHFRWETNYFLERFLAEAGSIALAEREALAQEFDLLADFAGVGQQTIVHRDFQSQNIMIAAGKPRVIDFQGARKGPPAYDVASILWDPYHRLDDAMRSRLLEFYLARTAERSGERFDEQGFRRVLVFCRLQRHMQALGAYGFLAKIKGKRYFLNHVPAALRYLGEEAELVRDSFPMLNRLVAGAG